MGCVSGTVPRCTAEGGSGLLSGCRLQGIRSCLRMCMCVRNSELKSM